MYWPPEYVETHAGSIAHHLAQHSKLTKRELLEVILEPFGIGYREDDPRDGAPNADERTLVRGCDAIPETAPERRRETLGGFPR